MILPRHQCLLAYPPSLSESDRRGMCIAAGLPPSVDDKREREKLIIDIDSELQICQLCLYLASTHCIQAWYDIKTCNISTFVLFVWWSTMSRCTSLYSRRTASTYRTMWMWMWTIWENFWHVNTNVGRQWKYCTYVCMFKRGVMCGYFIIFSISDIEKVCFQHLVVTTIGYDRALFVGRYLCTLFSIKCIHVTICYPFDYHPQISERCADTWIPDGFCP